MADFIHRPFHEFRTRSAAFALGASFMLMLAASRSATVTWTGNDGTGTVWNATANWSGGAVPGMLDAAAFGAAGTAADIGIHFASGTNNGAGNQVVGKISLDAAATLSRVIGNSSATAGTLTLSGLSGVIIENLSEQTLTLAPNVSGGTGGMSVAVPSGIPAVHAAGNIIIGANLAGNAFSKTGAGTLTLTGTNAQSGFGTVTGGVLQIGDGGTTGTVGNMHLALSNNANVTFNRSNSLTYTLDITGTGSVTQAGAGTTIFTGTGHNYSGGTTISAGTLQLGNGGTSGSLGTGTVSIAAGATLAVNRSNNYSLGGGNILSGAGALQKEGAGTLTLNANANAGFTGPVSILGGTLAVQSAAGSHSLSAAGSVSTSSTGTLSLTGGSAYTFSNTITGSGHVSYNGSGAVTLNPNNSYTGSTTISNISGALVVSHLANGGSNSSLGAPSADAANLVFNTGVLRYTGAGSSTDRLFSISGGGHAAFIEANGTGALEFTGTGAMGFNAQTGARDLVLQGTSAAGINNTLASLLGSNGGNTRVLKRGPNTWTLTGTASTYSGATNVEAGVLGVTKLADGGAPSSIGTSSSAAASVLMTNGGILRYSGTGDTTNRLFSIGGGSPAGGGIESSGSGAIIFNNTGDIGAGGTTVARTFTLGGTNTGENTLAARYTDMGSPNALTKNGTGKWILTANNTHTGVNSLAGGTLQLGTGGTSGTLGTGAVTFSNNATLVINRSDDLTLTQQLSGAGHLTHDGPGTTTLTNTNTFTGATVINAGALQLGNGGTTGSIANTTAVTNHGTLIINRSNAVTWTIPLGGSGGFTQAGAGTTTLAVSPAHTGPTTISAGKLQSTVSIALPSSDFTVGASGTLATNGSAQWTIGALNGSGIVENGAASGATTLTLGGSGTFTGLLRNGAAGTLAITKSGPGTQALDGANTHTGPTTITGGVLSTNSLANGGAASGIGASSSAAASLILNGGSLRYTGPGGSTDRQFHLGINGGGLDASGTGAVHFTSTAGIGFNGQSGARILTLGGSSTAANTLAAQVTDADAATALVKDGAGTWVLTHANTYSGGTTLNGGTLRISSSGAIGSGSVTFAGGVLETTQSLSIPNALVINNADNGVLVSAGTLTVNGPISGSFPLHKDGPGALIIASGSNAVPTIVQSGTVQGSASNAGTSIHLATTGATFEFSQNSAGTYGGIISGTGGITLSGGGSLELTAANTFSGPTVVSSGVLSVPTAGALGTVTSGVSVQDGGTLEIRNNTTVGAEALALHGRGAPGQAGALVSSSGVNTYGGAVTAATDATIAALPGSTLHLTGGLVKNGTIATLTGGGNIIISGAGISGASANSDLVVDGVTVTLNVTSSYNGPTFIQNSGQLVLGIDFALPASPRTAMSITSSGVFDLAGKNDAVATLAGTTSGTVKNSTVATTSALEIATTGGNTTYSGVIAGTNGGTQGDIALTKSGSGTQTLTGANTYSGGTTITGGSLQVGSGGTSGQLGTGAVTNNANLAVNRSDAVVLDQTITGTGTVSQVGSGTTILTGGNTYTGGTIIASGVLRLGNGGLTGAAGSGPISNDGQLQINRSNNITLGQAITGGGSLAQTGAGTTTLSSSSNTYSGGTTISTGTLVASNTAAGSSATGSGTVGVQPGARLAGSGRISGDVTFSTGSKLLIGNLIGDTHGQDFEFAGGMASLGAFEARFDLFSNLGTGTLNPSLAADQLLISGADRLISLDLDLVLDDPSSLLNWAAGDSWQIWSWGPVTSGNRALTVSSLTAPSLPGGLAWDTSQLNIDGTISITLVPEPARALLMLIGLGGLVSRRRRPRIPV